VSPSPSTSAPAPTNVSATPSGAAARWTRRIAYAVILLSLLTLVRLLPMGRLIDMLSSRVDQMGMMGLVVFGGAYFLAALLFVPGAALTLTAGAVFGLVRGTIVVSIASTLAAATAFLIGRHIARDAIVKRAATSPRFAAIDGAIGDGGWRVVALLRLSPAIPFSLGNYLYGLTAIRFVPYVLASWLAMLPGTFLYIYLGDAGRAGLEAAAGSGGRSPAEWALLGAGLLATIVVTVYVTRMARKAMRDGTALEEMKEAREDVVEAETEEAATPAAGRALATIVPVLIALVLLGGALYARSLGPRLAYLFGPPPAKLTERFADAKGKAHFDHSVFDRLLHRYVDDAGFVDYAGLAKESDQLDAYLAPLAKAGMGDYGRDERLALLLNAYNAFTLRLILDHLPISSIRDIPGAERWDAVRFDLGGTTYSLNQLEHEQIRPNFREPRVHFALVCAAVGCPPLRSEAYAADRLEAQLQSQAAYVHSHPRWLQYEPGSDVVHLTALYDWYGGDFKQVEGPVLACAARYAPALAKDLAAGRTPRIAFLDYDWALNSKENKR